jgi:phage terminase large subunit GpA-like protein
MIKIGVTCPHCGKENVVEMELEQYVDWQMGKKYIQDIFSAWTPAKRELLMSGICEDCWNKIFKD